jgi:predicted RNA-binding Zn-ribbon protein involved in translation (DUF1610 family)
MSAYMCSHCGALDWLPFTPASCTSCGVSLKEEVELQWKPTEDTTVAKPLPGISANVACPWCGGYVRGHQWIGQSNCSITTMERFYS